MKETMNLNPILIEKNTYDLNQILFEQLNFIKEDNTQIQNSAIKEKLNYMKNISHKLYGDNYIRDLTQKHYSKKKKIISPFKSLNDSLGGGFFTGEIYEINGPSLSGKTTLINSIISANQNNNEINFLFFDFLGNNLFSINQEVQKITYITQISLLEELVNYLTKLYQKIKNDKTPIYNVLIFDSLSMVLSKEIKLEDSSILAFTRCLNELSLKCNICIIYTCSVKRGKEEMYFDEQLNKTVSLNLNEPFVPNLFLPLKSAEISLYVDKNYINSKEYMEDNKEYYAKISNSFSYMNKVNTLNNAYICLKL